LRTAGPAVPAPSRARRFLLRFWGVLILLASAGAAVLQVVGPPPAAPEPAAASAAPPSSVPVPGPAGAPAAATATPPAAATSGDPLLEAGPYGMLPRIGPDGRTPIRAYGRAFDRNDTRPRIGLAVAGIGLSDSTTEEVMATLPRPVALIISPYAPDPARTAGAARAAGFELLAGLPMEPANFPLNDPGPRALLTGAPDAANADRLSWALSRFTGYVGVSAAIGGALRGERYAAMPQLLGQLQEEIAARGLLYLDPRPGQPAPARAWGRSVDLILDEPGGVRSLIEERLQRLEALAREHGSAMALAAQPSPTLVSAVAGWAAGLEARGAVLAPISALIVKPQEAAR